MRAFQGIEIRRDVRDAARVEEILRALPEWFGIEDALVDYVEKSKTFPILAAMIHGRIVGVCLLRHHTQYAWEIELLAVERALHRTGIGSELVVAAEADAASRGVEFLQVKTLGPSMESSEYGATRLFYEALGFRPLEEIEGLWPGNPCLILVKHLARSA